MDTMARTKVMQLAITNLTITAGVRKISTVGICAPTIDVAVCATSGNRINMHADVNTVSTKVIHIPIIYLI